MDNLEISIEKIREEIIKLTFVKLILLKSKHRKTLAECLFLHIIIQEKQNLAKKLRLRSAILSLQKQLKDYKKRRLLIRILICAFIILYTLFPIKISPIWAIEKLPTLVEKTKSNSDYFFFTKTKNKIQLNRKNILLTASALSLGTIVFVLLNTEGSVLNRMLFQPKLILSPVSFVALTLAEREELNRLVIQATTDINSRKLLLKGLSLTSSFQQLKGGGVIINASNAKRMMKLFARLMLNVIDTSHLITNYEHLGNEHKYLYPTFFVKIVKEILPSLQQYKSTFLKTFSDFVSQNDPILSSVVVSYFYTNMEALLKRDDLQSNEAIFNGTVDALLAAFSNEQSKLQ